MRAKRKSHFCFSYVVLFLLLGQSPLAKAATIDDLAGFCEKMESGINDISLSYELYIIETAATEKMEQMKRIVGAERIASTKDGYQRCNLSVTLSVSGTDPNNSEVPLVERVLFEQSMALVSTIGNAWDTLLKASYDGKIAKYLQINNGSQKVRTGGISRQKRLIPPPILTPLGFSVFRFRLSKVADNKSLSVVLKQLGQVDDTIGKINGFNTIRADILQETTKQICVRIYFSVEHGYTPVRYEYINGDQIAMVVDVHSLEQVTEGLWFPSSGLIRSLNDEQSTVYLASSRILVNQGLKKEYFDIDFPAGTKVYDETRGIRYVVPAGK